MKRLFLCLLCAVALDAQSISITRPASGDAVSGYAGYQFQVSLTSAPSVTQVCYTVDAYAAYDPGINAPTTLGCSLIPPFSYPYNSYWNGNGAHTVVATAYNSLNGVVATSAPVTFTIANTWPVACTDGSAPAWSVATSTATTSSWAGTVIITPTVSGSCATDSKQFSIYVDGISQGTIAAGTAAGGTFNIYTTQFQNGAHKVCATFNDFTNQSVISGSDITAAGDWCAAVDFQNGAVATSQAVMASDKIYLAPGATFTQTAAILNTDGSTTTGTPVFAISPNRAPGVSSATVATVNLSTGVVTAAATGMAWLSAMVPNFTGSTLHTNGSVCSEISTLSGPILNSSMNGWLLQVTGGSGWTTGVYSITAANNSTGAAILQQNGVNTCPAPAGTSGGVFSTGPTRTGQVFVWPSNTMPCFGPNGQIYSSYSASCFVVHGMFSSASLLRADPPFLSGVPAFFAAGGINTFEAEAAWTSLTGNESPTGQAAWLTAEQAYVSNLQNYLNGYPTLGWELTGQDFGSNSAELYASTNGPAGQWTMPPLEIALSTWSPYGNVRIMPMVDEVSGDWDSHPLQGPLSYGISAQSWLYTITALSGTCTVSNGGGISVGINAAHKFIIHGSAVANMNSVYPNVYTASSVTATGFAFPCAGVANGTYNAVSDPGLVLEPYATEWNANTSTGFAPYNVFATLANQAAASGATFSLGWPARGTDYCQPGWWGNTQFPGAQSIGGVSQIGGYADVYNANGNSQYLIQRRSANTIVNAQLYSGWTLRVMYGCYNPQLPLMMISTGTAVGSGNNGYGLEGYTVPVTSSSGNTITFSSPHGITNIIPGMTRLSITGAADSGGAADSTNSTIGTSSTTYAFYVLAAPTPTTLTVAMSIPDFSIGTSPYYSGTGGSFTSTGNGTATKSLVSSTNPPAFSTLSQCEGNYNPELASGICGQIMTYSGPVDATQTRNYGYPFTVSGISGTVTPNSLCLISGSCNLSRTFQMLAENYNPADGGNELFWREIPILSSTGGTATIVTDDNYVKGRNYSPDYSDVNADWAAGEEFECMIMRCSGTRIYKGDTAVSGYSSAQGFSGTNALGQIRTFADTTLGQQLFMNEYFENDDVVPIFHAHNLSALAWERWQKYIFQPRLNSPDRGSFFDTGAALGNYGNILMIFNATDAPQTQTIDTSAYLQSEQSFIEQIVTGHSIGAATTVAAGTGSVTMTIPAVSAAFLIFPSDFARELLQPSIAPDISTIANAASAVILYGYDPYYLDAAGNTFNCGSAAVCKPPWDRNIGTIYYRLEYLNGSGVRIAQSAVQTL